MQDYRHALVERDPPKTLSSSAVLLGVLAMTAALLVMFFLSACSSPPPAIPTDKPVTEESACGIACTHQREIGCELGTPTPGGATCEEVCEDNAKHGVSWNTRCLADATSCDDACP